jgi:hypothetical protein
VFTRVICVAQFLHHAIRYYPLEHVPKRPSINHIEQNMILGSPLPVYGHHLDSHTNPETVMVRIIISADSRIHWRGSSTMHSTITLVVRGDQKTIERGKPKVNRPHQLE